MASVKIFGREPVVVANAIEGSLALVLAFHWLDFIGLDSAEDMAVVMAVVSSAMGLYIAYVTKDTLLGALTGFIKAVIVLAAVFGYDLSAQQTAAIIGAATMVFAVWHRTQTGPAVVPSLDINQHSVEVPPEGEATATVPAADPMTGAVVEKAVPDQPGE